jgi:hypothetical protein
MINKQSFKSRQGVLLSGGFLIWGNEKGWTRDFIPVLSPILGIISEFIAKRLFC